MLPNRCHFAIKRPANGFVKAIFELAALFPLAKSKLILTDFALVIWLDLIRIDLYYPYSIGCIGLCYQIAIGVLLSLIEQCFFELSRLLYYSIDYPIFSRANL